MGHPGQDRATVEPTAFGPRVGGIHRVAPWAFGLLGVALLGALGGCKCNVDRSHPASARVVGVESRKGVCRYLVEVTAEDTLNEVVATVGAPGVLGLNFGPFEKGERRVLPLESHRKGACVTGAKARVTNTSPGQPPRAWAARYGLLQHGVHGLAVPRGDARCVVVTALRVARPGPVAPSVTIYDAAGKARETSAEDNVCLGRADPGLGVVYCATLARTPCEKVRRVVVTRGGETRRGRLVQARLRIERCDDVAPGRALIATAGAPVPPWAGRAGTRAFLLGPRGRPLTYAHGVARDTSGALDVRSARAKPCTEATLLVLQRQE